MKILIVIGVIAYIVLALILFFRLVEGPTASDRVLAADTIDNMTCIALAMYALYSGRSIYLDIAIVGALIGFLDTMFITRYLEGRMD